MGIHLGGIYTILCFDGVSRLEGNKGSPRPGTSPSPSRALGPAFTRKPLNYLSPNREVQRRLWVKDNFTRRQEPSNHPLCLNTLESDNMAFRYRIISVYKEYSSTPSPGPGLPSSVIIDTPFACSSESCSHFSTFQDFSLEAPWSRGLNPRSHPRTKTS